MGIIKDLREGGELVHEKPAEGLPTYPQESYPGYPVDIPTCSAPIGENTGCDSWKKCNTQGEGPYSVVYENTAKGTRNSCHCRLWQYRLKRKPDRYQPVDDPWVETVESVAIDPKDITAGTKLRRYSLFVENARMPFPGYKVHQLSEYENTMQSSTLPIKAAPDAPAGAGEHNPKLEPPLPDLAKVADETRKPDKPKAKDKK